MKICFLYESAFTLGGIQRCITALANYLVNRKYNVYIICTRTKVGIDRAQYGLDEKVKIIFTKQKSFFKKIINQFLLILKKKNNNNKFLNRKILDYIYSFLFKDDIEKIINENDFDVVLGCGGYFSKILSLVKNEKIKKVGWQHHSYDRYFNLHFKNEDESVEEMFENLDEYIVLTIDDKNKLKKFKGVDSQVIYNPIGFKQNEKSMLENKKFLALGRLNELKGFDLLIKSFNEFHKRNKEWTLDIVGDGSEKEKLQKQINEYNLCNFIKILPKTNNVKQLYKEASIYCMSSRAEGWGLVTLEAMESGLPVISYDIPCVKEIAPNNEVISVEKENYKKYAEAMLDLAKNFEKRKKLASKSIERAKAFSIENIGKQWEKLFKELKDNKGDVK